MLTKMAEKYPTLAYKSSANCLARSSAVKRVSGALILAFIALGGANSSILGSDLIATGVFPRAPASRAIDLWCALFRMPLQIKNPFHSG